MQGLLQAGLQKLEQHPDHTEDVPNRAELTGLLDKAQRLLQLKEAGNRYSDIIFLLCPKALLYTCILLDKAQVLANMALHELSVDFVWQAACPTQTFYLIWHSLCCKEVGNRYNAISFQMLL